MTFVLEEAVEILNRTPATLDALLGGLTEPWIGAREGSESWSPFDVVGHLIHGEETDWIPRVRHLLTHGESRAFEPFDRFAQLEKSVGKAMGELLARFAALRRESLAALAALALSPADLRRTGRHPELGVVTLGQHLATWVAHDLDHLGQVARVMATRYRDDVGPWRAYLRIVR